MPIVREHAKRLSLRRYGIASRDPAYLTHSTLSQLPILTVLVPTGADFRSTAEGHLDNAQQISTNQQVARCCCRHQNPRHARRSSPRTRCVAADFKFEVLPTLSSAAHERAQVLMMSSFQFARAPEWFAAAHRHMHNATQPTTFRL